MARVTNCIYCGGSLMNSNWHQECRLIEAEDILSIIKTELGKGKIIRGMTIEISERIINTTWTTKKVAEGEREKQQERTKAKKWWEKEKEEFLIKAEKEWEAKNPDPDPLMLS